MLACADIEEGIVLRRAGVTCPILVFGALSVSDLDGLFDYALTPTISTPSAARAVQASAAKKQTVCAYHLKIDTGMNRLGFRHDNLRRTLPSVLEQSEPAPRGGIYALCDGGRSRSTRCSTSSVCSIRRGKRDERPTSNVRRHAANSAALLRDSRVWYDFVRPGLLLYGIVPPPLASTIPLKPVMSLTSRVVAVKGLRPGEAVGYGSRFSTVRRQRRSPWCLPATPTASTSRLEGRGHVLIRGRRVPIVGAVSMDMMTVDVTGP